MTSKGNPCRKLAARGSDVCSAHRGDAKGGRPSLFNEAVADQLVAMLRAGNYVHVAARAAGISGTTFREWLRRGQSEEEADAPFRAFLERIEQARAEGQSRLVALVAKAAIDDWRAASWLLEREYPHLWGVPSARLRPAVETPTESPAPEPAIPEDDPFAEVDELAERRRAHV